MNNCNSNISYDGGMGDDHCPQQQISAVDNYFGDSPHGYLHSDNTNIPCSQPSTSTADPVETYPMATPEQMEQQSGAWQQNVLVQTINVAQACTNNVGGNAIRAPTDRGSAATASSFAASETLDEYNVSEPDETGNYNRFKTLARTMHECWARLLKAEKDLSVKMQEIKEQTERLQKEISDERDDKFAKRRELNQVMENQLRAREQTIKQKNFEIENLMKSLAEAETKEQEMLMEFKKLGDEFVDKEKQWNILCMEKQKKLEELSQSVVERRNKNISVQDTADKCENEANRLQNEKSALGQKFQEMSNLVETKKNSTIKQQIDELISEVSELNEEIEGLQANSERKGELLRLAQGVFKARANLCAQQTEINEMVKEIESAMDSVELLLLLSLIQLLSAQDSSSAGEDAPPNSPLTEQQHEKTMQADESNSNVSQEEEDDEGQCETERVDGSSILTKRKHSESGSGLAEEEEVKSEASQNLNSVTDFIHTEEETNTSPEGENLKDEMEHDVGPLEKIAKCKKRENEENAQQPPKNQKN